MDQSQVILLVAVQLFTLVWLVENLIEVPTLGWGSGDFPKFQIPTQLKPILAFLLGLGLSYVFGIGIAVPLGWTFIEAVAGAAAWIDAFLVGLICVRGSGLLNSLLDYVFNLKS